MTHESGISAVCGHNDLVEDGCGQDKKHDETATLVCTCIPGDKLPCPACIADFPKLLI